MQIDIDVMPQQITIPWHALNKKLVVCFRKYFNYRTPKMIKVSPEMMVKKTHINDELKQQQTKKKLEKLKSIKIHLFKIHYSHQQHQTPSHTSALPNFPTYTAKFFIQHKKKSEYLNFKAIWYKQYTRSACLFPHCHSQWRQNKKNTKNVINIQKEK